MKKLTGSYMHCKTCDRYNQADKIAVLTDGFHIQVWCETCDQEVVTVVMDREKDTNPPERGRLG